jgi:hypothetical protein
MFPFAILRNVRQSPYTYTISQKNLVGIMFSVNVVFCKIEKIGMMDEMYWKISKSLINYILVK